jgi:hypothetical protein
MCTTLTLKADALFYYIEMLSNLNRLFSAEWKDGNE